jgi:predicted GIY-YIG superfamily endonuclease
MDRRTTRRAPPGSESRRASVQQLMIDTKGIVYLLHFDPPYKHARHYLGWTTDLEHFQKRLENHRKGYGAHLTVAARKAGVAMSVVIKSHGTFADEQRLKRLKGMTRYCPECSKPPRRWPLELIA